MGIENLRKLAPAAVLAASFASPVADAHMGKIPEATFHQPYDACKELKNMSSSCNVDNPKCADDLIERLKECDKQTAEELRKAAEELRETAEELRKKLREFSKSSKKPKKPNNGN